MTQLNLHRLSIFLTVVETGGFSAAAQKLYMSQPSVSNHVRNLEQSLQTTLIDRSGPRIRPTAEGEVLAEYARRIFLLTEEAVAAIREVSGVQSGRLEVGGTTTVGTYLLPRLLARFRERHQNIECDIVVGNNGQILKRLLDGELGLAIVAGQPAAPQLKTETVLDERLLLVAAPGHPLTHPTPHITAPQLAGERFLLREPGSQTRDLQEAALINWDLDDMPKADMWGPETIKQSVAAGLGISLISEHAIDTEVKDGRLAVLEVDPPLRSRPVVIAYRRDRLLSPAERAFVALARGLRTWPDSEAAAG
ncbi:transcriptional regulator, LysR family [Catenulispora acidiphila DSM 44928]|uniref:Transcriptional regulator, LysR family n=1 Tax=Catenulispora acidiphila (strain DSM 44928 / JCM 14897 / NBRC 102108 / NRRL B-24433 / ID139908) TaxID=479433 RepID=C7QF45_CATAD|nr:LysR family transcriptional regulator [Catenulispora acidiphila]ACU74803.1 transcriptional regulator, LysR family [Catenulispora acidiphila DSM 44928]